MGYGREAEHVFPWFIAAGSDASKGTGEEGGQDSHGDFEDIGVDSRVRRDDVLHEANDGAEEKYNRHIDGTRLECPRADTSGCQAAKKDHGVFVVSRFTLHDVVQVFDCLADADNIMDHVLVDIVCFSEPTEIEALDDADELHLGGVGGHVVKGHDHAAGEIQKLSVEIEHPRRHLHVFFQTMGRSSVSHQGATELHDVFLASEHFGNMHGQFDLVFAFLLAPSWLGSGCIRGQREGGGGRIRLVIPSDFLLLGGSGSRREHVAVGVDRPKTVSTAVPKLKGLQLEKRRENPTGRGRQRIRHAFLRRGIWTRAGSSMDRLGPGGMSVFMLG